MKLKKFSYLKSGLIGTAIGAPIGAGIQYYRYRKDNKAEKRRRMIKGAAIGAGVGAGLGLGAEYAKNSYQQWLGTPEIADLTEVRANLKAGDVVSADRGLYKHYGIVSSDGKIIEYGSEKFDPRTAKVSSVSLEHFSGGDPVSIENVKTDIDPKEIVQRAVNQIGKERGTYNLRNNNCEHFAMEMATGKKQSTQADKFNQSVLAKANNLLKIKRFSKFKISPGDRLAAQQFRNYVENGLFKDRAKLTKELGGLSHFNKHQTAYLMSAGSGIGAVSGSVMSSRKAKKDAVNKYGLQKGTLDYDNYVRSRRRSGALTGASIGAGLGFGTSKGVDYLRGHAISDKAKVLYKGKLDLGKNYVSIGKSLRGITSEKDVQNIKTNIVETGDYLRSLKNML